MVKHKTLFLYGSLIYSISFFQKQKTCTDEDIRQKRKLELHGQKEIQSGLFVYEKVIKLSNPLEEEEDVNILE